MSIFDHPFSWVAAGACWRPRNDDGGFSSLRGGGANEAIQKSMSVVSGSLLDRHGCSRELAMTTAVKLWTGSVFARRRSRRRNPETWQDLPVMLLLDRHARGLAMTALSFSVINPVVALMTADASKQVNLLGRYAILFQRGSVKTPRLVSVRGRAGSAASA